MNSGYQQFFKKAQEVASADVPSSSSHPHAKVRTPFKIKPQLRQKETPPKKATRTFLTAEQMSQQLRERLKNRPRRIRAKSVPWKIVGFSVVGILATAIGLQNSSQLEKYLKGIEISYMGYAAADEKKPVSEEKKPGDIDKAGKASGESVQREFTDEEINHFAKLNERKRELDAREEELNRLETELATQKAALGKRLQDLESTRRQISSILEDRVQADDKKVDSLVQVYSNMKPIQAAKIFETMDEDLAIDILGRMKKKPAAEILNLVKSEKAQILSEKYAGYKRP